MKIFCFEPIVIFVFLDSVLFEYSSSSSSQEFFSTFWNLEEPFKSAHFSLNLGTKNLAKFGTQQGRTISDDPVFILKCNSDQIYLKTDEQTHRVGYRSN